jgi:PqqD family protein of HPr-rel-A system
MMIARPDMERRYRAEKAEDIIVRPLDAMTLIYQRRSGITHIVAEPVPQILEVMGADSLSTADITLRLTQEFDLGDNAADIVAVVAERMEELATLGLVEASDAA